MRAIILAAGIGSRLGEIGKNTPKCLIEIGGKTILERQIEIFESCGIKKEDIFVVMGSQGAVWTKENEKRIRKIHNNLIVNDKNVDKNQSYSLWLALQKIDDSVICVDGDTIFDGKIVKELLRCPEKSILPFRKARENDNRRKILTENGRVVRISKEVESDKVYTPIIKLDRPLVNGIRQELAKGLYFNDTLEIVINAVCNRFEIKTISLAPLEALKPSIININTPEAYNLAQNMFS